MRRSAPVLATAGALAVITIGATAITATADCPGGFGPTIPLDPNVGWVTLPDSITGCPAGDSVLAGRPSRIRGIVFYGDECDQPRVGVPPESIWVTVTILSGNLKVNDKSTKIFAEDSTDAQGRARITIPSLSGCGRLRLNLFVSGVAQDPRNVTARTTDTNADGRTAVVDDAATACDLDYDGFGMGDFSDKQLVLQEEQHWRFNALHGTPVRRTTSCITCLPRSANTLGDGNFSWEPNGDRLAFSLFVHRDSAGQVSNDCHVFLVPSDPTDGNTLVHFTFPSIGFHDYDPTWSPVLGREIAFARCDESIFRKGVAGISPDTSEILVTRSGDGCPFLGDLSPSFSPGGDSLAFVRFEFATGAFHIWKIALSGGSPTQLTSGANVADRFPRWSPDGRWIFFQRTVGGGAWGVYRVAAQGGTPELVYMPQTMFHSRGPAISPDGRIVTTGRTTTVNVTPMTIRTIDPALAPITEPDTTKLDAILNYEGFLGDAGLFPQLSPDGTRLAFLARPPGTSGRDELWAVRRNMNLPPVLAQIGGSNELFQVEEGDPLNFTFSATDTENDPLTYEAFFLKLGMMFDPVTRTFSWTPPAGTANNTYHINFRVTTPSAGTDAQAVRVKVIPQVPKPGRSASRAAEVVGLANPSRGPFVLMSNQPAGRRVVLEVVNVMGRVIYRHETMESGRVVWRGTDNDGSPVPSGIYFYRLLSGGISRTGKWVLMR